MKKNNGWELFLRKCLSVKTEEELEKFFELFMTIEERHDMANRYLIIKKLLSGDESQRIIAKNLKVSIAKITRGSNSLKVIDSKLKTILID